jgi:hypothetical protein
MNMAADTTEQRPIEVEGPLNYEEAYQYITKIFQSDSILKVQEASIDFLNFTDTHKKHRRLLCRLLTDYMARYNMCHFSDFFSSAQSRKKFVIIAPDQAPAIFVTTCVPYTTKSRLVMKGLHAFIQRCGEFEAPIEAAISEAEINAVLNAAQKTYRFLEIAAPLRPLKILRFNNSHAFHNCECGLSGSEAIILVYHPRTVEKCGRVFIFAHELGHALHLALTNSSSVLPDGFAAFNEQLGITWDSISDQQEAFADVFALALLSAGGLKRHLPPGFAKKPAPYFHEYIRHITEQYFLRAPRVESEEGEEWEAEN